jgi:hypothetical protein
MKTPNALGRLTSLAELPQPLTQRRKLASCRPKGFKATLEGDQRQPSLDFARAEALRP